MATPIPSNRARFLLSEVALATGGTIVHRAEGVDEPAAGVFSDSRAVVPGSIFVALRGEAHDGHAFVAAAIAKGARVVVVDKSAKLEAPAGASVVEVDDTLVAWGALARAHLTRWRMASVDGRVVAITGSAGKTTTKELTAALLAEIAPTHFTAGNLNNRIGVPAVIFALEPEHRFCVLEMGMSLPGELDAICDFAKPDVAVVVNVGVAHAEGVGGREGVMKEKGAVYRALGSGGIAIVNADDEYVQRAAREARVRRVETFGRGASTTRRPGSFAEEGMAEALARPPSRPSSLPPSAPSSGRPHYRLVDRTPDGAGSRVVVSCAGREITFHLPLAGEAAAIDLTAALAAQEAVSREVLTTTAIEHALASLRLEGRGALRTLAGDVLLLDDTYNANPASMRAALATLAEIAGNRRKVVVLGEMKELGALAEAEHDALGDAIADAGVALAIGCGGLVDRALDRAAARDVAVARAADTAEAAGVARERVTSGDAVLVKGSRSARTEVVVAELERRQG
ncbi:MAG: UDP-N-acetylmuramoylalanyl-D-glutamyl-2, 6-diaminopimelate--D-alanyl-D-alanine ligase [Labilithrix sp.]|nr:UDP-N-acetylmuramoylalanyl-D-glutamyl-2, 6-diaminopimelate--D-alanyl-D-alanine ligase [Labilithrix sp.]